MPVVLTKKKNDIQTNLKIWNNIFPTKLKTIHLLSTLRRVREGRGWMQWLNILQCFNKRQILWCCVPYMDIWCLFCNRDWKIWGFMLLGSVSYSFILGKYKLNRKSQFVASNRMTLGKHHQPTKKCINRTPTAMVTIYWVKSSEKIEMKICRQWATNERTRGFESG